MPLLTTAQMHQSPSTRVAIAFGVSPLSTLTPARSSGGWTRGMPPPARPSPLSRPPPSRAVRMTATREVRPGGVVGEGADATVEKLVLERHAHGAVPGPVPAVGGTEAVMEKAGSGTRAVHGGERVRGGKKVLAVTDAIVTPIVQSSTFTFRNTEDLVDYNRGQYESFEYGRYGSPTTRAAEEKIMALERAEDCLLSASGMNSVTTMLLALVPRDGHIVTTTDCYRRTRQFVRTLLPKMGVRCTVIDPADTDELRRVFAEDKADLFFSESPTNPLIRVVDTPAITALCKEYNVVSVIDTTFATPINFRPIEHDADLVLHSGTKYLAGHNDVLCGALAGRADLIAKVRSLHGVLGGVLDPHAAYLLLRGLKTLPLRMLAHNRNAASIADFLAEHPKVAVVHYPTQKSHPDHEVATRLFPDRGFGGVISFEIVGDKFSRDLFERTGRFIDALRIPYIGPSMGGSESLVEQVAVCGYYDQPLSERERLGITNGASASWQKLAFYVPCLCPGSDLTQFYCFFQSRLWCELGLIRYACGIEDSADLIDDLAQALEYA